MRVCTLKAHLTGAKLYRSDFLPRKDKDGVEHHWVQLKHGEYFVSQELWDDIMKNEDVIGPIGGM